MDWAKYHFSFCYITLNKSLIKYFFIFRTLTMGWLVLNAIVVSGHHSQDPLPVKMNFPHVWCLLRLHRHQTLRRSIPTTISRWPATDHDLDLLGNKHYKLLNTTTAMFWKHELGQDCLHRETQPMNDTIQVARQVQAVPTATVFPRNATEINDSMSIQSIYTGAVLVWSCNMISTLIGNTMRTEEAAMVRQWNRRVAVGAMAP